MKNSAAIALLVARAAAQRADMAQDRAVPAAVLKASTAEDECTDTAVTAAKTTLSTATSAFTTQETALTTATTAVGTALTDQTAKIKVVADYEALTANAAAVKLDIDKDKDELAKRRILFAKNHAKAAALAALTAATNAKTAANNAKVAADNILSAATTAETNAGTHLTRETTLQTTKLAAMNTAMGTWKGRNTPTDQTIEDVGKASTAYAAGSKAKEEETALANLKTAVGSCARTSPAWDGGLCEGGTTPTTTGLVKYALRKKKGVDLATKAVATRETLLDAYCRASMTLGTSDADLQAGKEYYARANPGKRLDFDFSTTVANLTNDTYKTTWTWETLGAPVAATGNAANQWNQFKCVSADVTAGGVTTTGNTGRAYSTGTTLSDTVNSGIAYATTLPIGDLATKVTAGNTERDTATTGLEAKFTAWKTAAHTAMTAYKTMITDDAAVHATSASDTAGCKTGGTAGTNQGAVLTQYQHADALLAASLTAAITNEATAQRPSNRVAAITDPASTTAGATLVTAIKGKCLDECYKLPSWGLLITGSGSQARPTVKNEVCHGTETSTSTTAAVAALKTACKFISSAIANATPTLFIDVAAGTGSNLRCDKRNNTKGLLWRTAVIAAATGKPSTTGYPAVNANYTGFTAAVTAWVAVRENVITSYKNYLRYKTTCQKVGKSYLSAIDDVARTKARVSGVRGTDITHKNLTEMYEDEWTKVYGEVPAVLALLDTTNPYLSLAPPNQKVTGTGTYALYLQAKEATAVAAAAHATAKAEWNAQKLAVTAQTAVKTLATNEKAAATTSVGSATSGLTQALATATTAYTAADTAKTAADTAASTASTNYDNAKTASTNARTAANTIYSDLVTKRAAADTAVTTTQTKIGLQTAARTLLATKKTAKDNAEAALATALTTCKNTKYDAYRAALATSLAERDTKLKTIKTLLETKDAAKKKAGETGARCEKALSQGNGRAARVKPCTSESDCCGAAKGTVVATTVWATAPLMTIETCQAKTATTYAYYPPRAPMATVDPTTVAANKREWPFACIAGASNLAAAATALATAAYMMA